MSRIPLPSLPRLAELAVAFTEPTFRRVGVRLLSALLTTGRRTVPNLLRTVGGRAQGDREEVAARPARRRADRERQEPDARDQEADTEAVSRGPGLRVFTVWSAFGTIRGRRRSCRATGECVLTSAARRSPTRRRHCGCWRPATRR